MIQNNSLNNTIIMNHLNTISSQVNIVIPHENRIICDDNVYNMLLFAKYYGSEDKREFKLV